MKILRIILVLSSVVLFTCENNNTDEQNELTNTSETEAQILTAKDIERFRYNDYGLSRDTQEATLLWSKYKELETQISFLKKADVSFFTSDKDTLKAFLISLKETQPELLKTNPIDARISVLETTILKFNNELTLDNYSKADKLKSIKALLVANSNLIYLMNKKLEFDKTDIERPSGLGRSQDSTATIIDDLEDIEIID